MIEASELAAGVILGALGGALLGAWAGAWALSAYLVRTLRDRADAPAAMPEPRRRVRS